MATTVWRGNLTFGLVSIPVRLFRAARPERIRFHQLRRSAPAEPEPETETGETPPVVVPIRRSAAPSPAPEPAPEPVYERVRRPLPASEEAPIVKGYEYGKDRYVVVDPRELRGLEPQTSRTMEIREFVLFSEIDPVFLENSYYVAPDAAGEKPYSMLFAALQRTGYAALAEFAMHRREHVVVLRSGRRGLIAHTLFYSDEVRAAEEFSADPAAVGGKELELSELLVRTLAAPFDPEKYRDRYRERVQALISARMEGRHVVEAPQPERADAVPDIMEALRLSLAAARKPPAKESAAPGRAKQPRGRKRG